MLTCSAKGCAADAVWELLWNNPRLHTPDRRKSWLACDAHRGTLADFLSARGFLRGVEPLDRSADHRADDRADDPADHPADDWADPGSA